MTGADGQVRGDGTELVGQLRAQFRCTRAITIDAPPDAVWPWLVQVGCLRGGFYNSSPAPRVAQRTD